MGLHRGIYRDNGKENGNYYRVWGLGFRGTVRLEDKGAQLSCKS